MPDRPEAVLVTGGAGYIGSSLILQMKQAGQCVVVYDNLSTGYRGAVPEGVPLVTGDTTDYAKLRQLFATYHFGSVIHLAAKLVVPESVADPLFYYTNNVQGTLTLLRCCAEFETRHLIFSSTAAVYGDPASNPVSETFPLRPMNPYGHSKLMSEQMIRDFAASSSLRFVILRYFNVAGADPDTRFGQRNPAATHLIKIACDAALGRRNCVSIFGTDYDTPDGTGVRDYIHVDDLAAAHLNALRYLRAGKESATLNCGYGQGYSVREVLDVVERLSGTTLPLREMPRRPGDPACVIADASAIRTVLDWTPRYAELETIVGTALAWEKKLGSEPSPE